MIRVRFCPTNSAEVVATASFHEGKLSVEADDPELQFRLHMFLLKPAVGYGPRVFGVRPLVCTDPETAEHLEVRCQRAFEIGLRAV